MLNVWSRLCTIIFSRTGGLLNFFYFSCFLFHKFFVSPLCTRLLLLTLLFKICKHFPLGLLDEVSSLLPMTGEYGFWDFLKLFHASFCNYLDEIWRSSRTLIPWSLYLACIIIILHQTIPRQEPLPTNISYFQVNLRNDICILCSLIAFTMLAGQRIQEML